MSKLIYCYARPLMHESRLDDIPGFSNFRKVAKFMKPSVSFMDRTGTIQPPFKTKITDPIPKFDPSFNLSYADCVMTRMSEMDALQKLTGKKFRLMYSGGIDSSLVFAAFVQYYGLEHTSQLLEICCSRESIDENPWLWDRYIRKGKFKLVSSHTHSTNWNDDIININCELNDMLHGGNGLAANRQNKNLYDKISIDSFLDTGYVSGQGPDSLYYIDLLIKQAESAPFKLENSYQIAWWYNFSLFYHTVKLLAQSRFDRIPAEIINVNNNNFYHSDLFQQWSMKFHLEHSEKYCEFENYRKFSMNLILDILDIPEYADKFKYPSFPRVHTKRLTAYYIDEDYNMYRNIDDIRKFIEPNNSFL